MYLLDKKRIEEILTVFTGFYFMNTSENINKSEIKENLRSILTEADSEICGYGSDTCFVFAYEVYSSYLANFASEKQVLENFPAPFRKKIADYTTFISLVLDDIDSGMDLKQVKDKYNNLYWNSYETCYRVEKIMKSFNKFLDIVANASNNNFRSEIYSKKYLLKDFVTQEYRRAAESTFDFYSENMVDRWREARNKKSF